MDILRDLGYMIRIHSKYDDGATEIMYEASTDGVIWKSFEDFIKEDVDVSHHELIRKNVVTATRFCYIRFYVLVFFNLCLDICTRDLRLSSTRFSWTPTTLCVLCSTASDLSSRTGKLNVLKCFCLLNVN